MNIKGIKKYIERTFNIKSTYGGEFEYNYEDEVVTFTDMNTDTTDEVYRAYVLERFGYKIEHPFAFSVLHELGHCFNNDWNYGPFKEFDYDNTVSNFCVEQKKEVDKLLKEAETKPNYVELYKKILFERYFNLPDEIMATDWAIKYAKRHLKVLDDLEKLSVDI